MERGTWRATVHGVTKESDTTKQLSARIHTHTRARARTHTHMHARTHTHTHTHIHFMISEENTKVIGFLNTCQIHGHKKKDPH